MVTVAARRTSSSDNDTRKDYGNTGKRHSYTTIQVYGPIELPNFLQGRCRSYNCSVVVGVNEAVDIGVLQLRDSSRIGGVLGIYDNYTL